MNDLQYQLPVFCHQIAFFRIILVLIIKPVEDLSRIIFKHYHDFMLNFICKTLHIVELSFYYLQMQNF